MDDDESDLKKIVDVIKLSREENENNDDFQYQEFITFDDDSDEDEEIGDDVPLPADQDYEIDQPFKFDLATLYKYDPIPSLKPAEKIIIDSCEDPELKTILILNRQKNMQLIQLYKKFKDLLIESKQNILDKEEMLKQYYTAHKAQSQSSGSWRVGAPYFKDKGFYVAPLNDDGVRKKANDEISYIDVLPLKKWTSYECDRLLKSVKLNYNINQITEVKRNIKLLSASDDMDKDNAVRVLELKLIKLNDTENLAVPPLGSDENINWIRVADIFVRDKHSDFECRSFWNMFLHPDINKSKWTPIETRRLVELVKKYKHQNWVQIAKDLGTNRTCLNVAIHYFSHYHNTYKRGEFTYSEDKKLLELVAKYKMGNFIPWVRIVRHFKNRTRAQLHHRFTYYLNAVDKKKGKFSEAEDIIVLVCVEKFGRNFKKCSEYLTERSTTQIKTRYSSGLQSFVKKETWTISEDRLILEFVRKRGPLWTEISKLIERSTGQIRQRYNIVTNYLGNHPGTTLEDVPRRKHYIKEDVEKFCVIRHLVQRLTSSSVIPSVEEVEAMVAQIRPGYTAKTEQLESDEDSEPDDKTLVFQNDDDLLTDFFCNSSDQDVSVVRPQVLKKTLDDVELLLDLLKVNLDLPKNIKNHPQLDALDKKILTGLSQRKSDRKQSRSASEVTQFVPPHFCTTTGIRSLLDAKHRRKRPSTTRISGKIDIPFSVISRVKCGMNMECATLDNVQRNRLEIDRTLFFRRFLSLFKWPSILTLENPSKEFISEANNMPATVRPQIKRTYSRTRNTAQSTSTSIEQASKVRILGDNAKESLKLTPVTDKSIIMNLMKDNSKKLFRLDKVKCGNETKTLVKEVNLNFLPSREENRSVQRTAGSSVSGYNNKKVVGVADSKVTINALDAGTLKQEANAGCWYGEEDIDISDTTLLDTSDIFESNESDLADLEKLNNFIKREKHS